jgi:uncharacterized protein (DUF58 family)
MAIIFLTIAAMPFVLFGILCYVYNKVTVELNSLHYIVNKSEKISIAIQCNNPTVFPISNMKIYLSYKNSFSHQSNKKDIKLSLDARTKTTVYCNINSEYAGNLVITLYRLRLYDYMKIFSLRKKREDKIQVAVLPMYYELPEDVNGFRSNSVMESEYFSTLKSGDDPSEVFSIREYREGDRLQRIHWKLSMKQDQLMIKEFSDPLNCSVLLFVNFSIPAGEAALALTDAILECSLSLSFSLLKKGQIHYITWFDTSLGSCRRIRITRENDFFETVDGLLRARLYTRETDVLSAYIAEHPNDQYSDVYFITGEMTRQQTEIFSLYRTINRQIVYIFNDEGTYSSEVPNSLSDRSKEFGIEVHPLTLGNIKSEMEELRLC